MKSVARYYLDRTEEVVWHRGESYADQGRVDVSYYDEKKIEAVVAGTRQYKVTIRWIKSGLRKSCTCPYPGTVCKHVVATAIVWDALFGIARPSREMVESRTIQPPPFSRQQISTCFDDPLNANLDIIRIAVDYFARSPRPHAQLPKCPRIDEVKEKPMNLREVKSALKEMVRWTKRKSYHYYFCAGEMAAAFSELLDVIETRMPASEPGELIQIMAFCVDWYYRKFNQIVDGSDGVWIFPKVRIGKIVALLKERFPIHPSWKEFNGIVEEVGDWWGEPNLNAEVIAGWKDIFL